MALRIAPPQHNVTAPAEWIPPTDPAWDMDRIEAERKQLGARAQEHPVNVYYAMKTRFDLAAPITVPEPVRSQDGPSASPVTAWLKSDPTVFTLGILGALDWELATSNTDKMYWELCRRGILDVRNIDGVDGEPVTKLPRDIDGKTSRAWLDLLSQANRRIMNQLGDAIYALNLRQGAGAEGKP